MPSLATAHVSCSLVSVPSIAHTLVASGRAAATHTRCDSLPCSLKVDWNGQAGVLVTNLIATTLALAFACHPRARVRMPPSRSRSHATLACHPRMPPSHATLACHARLSRSPCVSHACLSPMCIGPVLEGFFPATREWHVRTIGRCLLLVLAMPCVV